MYNFLGEIASVHIFYVSTMMNALVFVNIAFCMYIFEYSFKKFKTNFPCVAVSLVFFVLKNRIRGYFCRINAYFELCSLHILFYIAI